MNTSNINYEDFLKGVEELQQQGITPTLRLIRNQLGGGSFTKLLKFLQTWREQNEMANQSGIELSQNLKQSLIAEFARVVKATRAQYDAKVEEQEKYYHEAMDLINEAESKVAQLEQELIEQKQEADQAILAFQRQLAALEQKNTTLEEQIKKLEHNLTEAIRTQESARTEAATSKLELKHAQQALEKSEKKTEDALKKQELLQKQVSELEVSLAVLKTRAEIQPKDKPKK